MNSLALREQKCQPQVDALTDSEIADLLPLIDEWSLQDGRIERSFSFGNYHDTLAFVNAIAYVIHAEDHHPELTVTFNRCVVRYNTHSVNAGAGGLTQNDFICAAKIDTIFAQSFAPSLAQPIA